MKPGVSTLLQTQLGSTLLKRTTRVVVVTSIISFADFSQETEASKLEVRSYMKNFCPTPVDTERLFSVSRISKNYLQGRLTPENHRNVYLRKNEHLLYENFVQ